MPSSVKFWVGLDVHKESITAAVFRNRDPEPIRVDRLPYDLHKVRRYFQRLQGEGAVRACYEASGAGYVLQRSLVDWGVPCELAAPSLIPQRAGERRKSDRRAPTSLPTLTGPSISTLRASEPARHFVPSLRCASR